MSRRTKPTDICRLQLQRIRAGALLLSLVQLPLWVLALGPDEWFLGLIRFIGQIFFGWR